MTYFVAITKEILVEGLVRLFKNNILQSQDLRVDQEKESCIEFTQENSIENSIQDCLPYILKLHSLC